MQIHAPKFILPLQNKSRRTGGTADMPLTKFNRLAAALGSALLGLSASAIAQEATPEDETTLESVVVTGSKIRRTDFETSQPVLSLSKADIKATGISQVGDLLQSLPSIGASLNQTYNNGGNGSTYVDLRNLGTSRTLVLVNGKRYAPDGNALSGVVDLNSIPTSIIERIEVLKDGASTIYGSDAIAGVINIITIDQFEGMEANAYIGENSEGDGRTQSYDFTAGASNDTTSIIANISFQKNEAIFAGDRDISAVPQFGAVFCASSTSPEGRFGLAGRSGTFTLTNTAALPPGQVQSATNIRPFNIPADCYNFAPDNYLLTPQQRYAGFAKIKHSVRENITFRSEFVYNNRTSAQLLAPVPVTFAGNGLFGPNNVFDVSAQSFYNPFGVNTTRVQRRLNETGGRKFSQSVDVWHYSGGFEGYFDLWDRNFNWDAGYTFSLNQQSDITTGQVNFVRVRDAVGPSFRDAQGVLRCGTATNIIAGCVPLNLFGGNGSITPDQLAYISVPLQDAYEYRRTGYQANLSGDIAELPAGMLAFATGYEYRRESGFDLPDALTATGASSGNIRQPTAGGYAVDEFFGELSVPILAGMTGAETLELSLASRYSDFDTFGDTTNSKIGIKWKPISDLLIRASYAEGFRAPDINALFQGNSDSFQTISDPCTGAGQATANRFATLTAAQRANCLAAGVPATGAQQASGQVRATVGGNPNLTPETSISKSYGFIYNPEYLPGFDISVDRWEINLENIINALGGQTILDACILGGAAAQCSLITRLAGTGATTGVLDTNLNAGTADLTGWDLGASYRFDTENYGGFRVNIDATYLEEYKTVTPSGIPNDPLVFSNPGNYYGTGLSDPRLKSNLYLTWNYQDFGVTWAMRFKSRLQENCTNAVNPMAQCSDPNGLPFNVDGLGSTGLEVVPTNKIASTTYHDAQVRWSAPWNATLSGGIRNLFDRDPPVAISASNNSFDPSYDIPGRFFYMSYTQKF
jgi:iron complex outermembrane recepter protein